MQAWGVQRNLGAHYTVLKHRQHLSRCSVAVLKEEMAAMPDQEEFVLWNADGRPEGKAEEYSYKAENVVGRQDGRTDDADRRGDP